MTWGGERAAAVVRLLGLPHALEGWGGAYACTHVYAVVFLAKARVCFSKRSIKILPEFCRLCTLARHVTWALRTVGHEVAVSANGQFCKMCSHCCLLPPYSPLIPYSLIHGCGLPEDPSEKVVPNNSFTDCRRYGNYILLISYQLL